MAGGSGIRGNSQAVGPEPLKLEPRTPGVDLLYEEKEAPHNASYTKPLE